MSDWFEWCDVMALLLYDMWDWFVVFCEDFGSLILELFDDK